RIAGGTGLLYGINTLGAVVGVVLATFVLFPQLGLYKTNLTGAAIDVAVGLFTLLVLTRRTAAAGSRGAVAAARAPGDAPVARAERAPEPDGPLWPLLLSYASVGFTALVYEVTWTRTLSMVLGSSIYAFAAMLAAFLSGIALGSLALRRWEDSVSRPRQAYAI